ncbi:guanosine-5'-triphosphate,3'-diphosphate diphosphatase [Pseudoalteromonas tunicata]|uniref:Guanosine-5'-triphosphate,3'-diphosphate pyrophosphatase n=1 Tax=Pseudoalteromonas tunicata D2 TaxID=87626 RepID=A4CFA1_9GAMM|nr:guanosine-5'-triphosphate,3'-diphosphate diphosphatase [Pseudoalteromonas tunicata]ATC92964.1 exopolyphosphatase / guanosine-5'-triphosphate,3'-diphosphate pyrophosphatase [Pseudoalteromonas tunicata]AXT32062.1 guanosine-5'-triphosphate,3'-diphosphate diphosphatase [Pseudoalteromonas tunicata]EAR26539.1 Guanosine-5'-triphosphate,3'-diphosphate pyrophosphatase (Guanosine pentaphosphate phosphohydrolase) [Pseudoalteromonas tunicata D2]MDP4983073.1 guanosine-5'-triphosphate,3'-diphosphate dipho
MTGAQYLQHQNVYAVIDLGSNSFHMLIAKSVAGSLQTIGRLKRKVRLAAGLDSDNVLNLAAMQRGWECLSLFAERLQDIPAENITIVATATLRLASNAHQFIEQAERILNHKINIISGETEAKTIYKGVAYTSAAIGKQLVIDIGGASTEVVIGDGFTPLHYKSLDMGCVTYLERYFPDGHLTHKNFDAAIKAAHQVISVITQEFKQAGWLSVSGASGTVQAIQEIMIAQRQDDLLTLDKLNAIKHQAVLYKNIHKLELPGLLEERRLVFASGLAILIALFEALEIDTMGLAGGALREGVLYSMIPELQNQNIRQRTLDSFIERYHVDQVQGLRVAELAKTFAMQLEGQWHLAAHDGEALLYAAAQLHEVGLLIEYKQYQKHTGYIVKNTDMPGYSQTQHKMLVQLVKQHRADIELKHLCNFGICDEFISRLLRVLRLAFILTMRRKNDVLPAISVFAEGEVLTIELPNKWLEQHPLMQTELEQEVQYQKKAGWELRIQTSISQ